MLNESSGSPGATSPPLRVCHLAYTFFENDNRVLRYAEALRDKGHDVDVIALRRPEQARNGYFRNVRVFRIQDRSRTEKRRWVHLAKTSWFLAHAAYLLAKLSIMNRYDLVHVHNVPDFLVFAAIVPKLWGTRVILDIHDALPELYSSKFRAGDVRLSRAMLAIERLSCHFADHVIVANDVWRERIVQRSVPAARCTTILNYPDLRVFGPQKKSSRNEIFRVIYPGSLSRHQGIDVLLRAFRFFTDRVAGAELFVYGDGPAGDDLRKLSSDLGIGHMVTFLSSLPIDQMPAVMAAAAVGVEPKGGDGFSDEALGTKILEFMACGLPVIAARTTVNQRYFNDRVLRFFPPGNAEALADALVETHAKWASHEVSSCDASDFAMRYSWQEHEADYHNLLKPQSKPAPDRDSRISAQ